jgi:diaminopimelate epimerase
LLELDFVKSHGLGNDYVVVDAAHFGITLTPERVRLLCHRHLGLGSDGILEVTAADDRFVVRIWNPDGSLAERSGNGLRIVAKFLSDHGYTDESAFSKAAIDRAVTALPVRSRKLDVTVVSVGNPHCVIFGEPHTRKQLFELGPQVENHAQFPARINVQLAEVESRRRVRALVWERGAGHTLASGTSACAVAAACFDRGLVGGAVSVVMEGGQLEVEVASDLSIIMTGPVEEVFEGTLSPDLRRRLAEVQ